MDFLSCLVYIWLTWVLIRSVLSIWRGSSRLPPGPAPLPVVGNLFQLGKKPHKSLAELAKTHGPILTLRVFNKTTVVISSAAMAKEVLQKQDLSFSTHRAVPDSARAHRHHQASMVWLPISAKWRTLRRIANSHLFAAHVLDGYAHLRRQKVQQLLAGLTQAQTRSSSVRIGNAAFATTFNLLSTTVFTADCFDPTSDDSVQQVKEVVSELTEMFGKPNMADYFPALSRLDPQGIRRRMAVLLGKMFEVFDSFIEQRLQRRKKQQLHSAAESKDLLDILLDIHEDDTTDLSMDEIRHLILDLFVAGTDTTSSTVEWAMAELLRNAGAMSKVRAEMAESIGRGNPVEEKDIARLPYLQAVVKETFRLHPPVPFLIPRRVEAAAGVEICGFSVPKDAEVLVNAWAIGRDPEAWTANPDAFMPERFLGSDLDVKGRDFGVIPFGAGRRICPGLPLATGMVQLMVASLIHSFEWRLEGEVAAEAMDMDEKFGIALQKARPLIVVPVRA